MSVRLLLWNIFPLWHIVFQPPASHHTHFFLLKASLTFNALEVNLLDRSRCLLFLFEALSLMAWWNKTEEPSVTECSLKQWIYIVYWHSTTLCLSGWTYSFPFMSVFCFLCAASEVPQRAVFMASVTVKEGFLHKHKAEGPQLLSRFAFKKRYFWLTSETLSYAKTPDWQVGIVPAKFYNLPTYCISCVKYIWVFTLLLILATSHCVKCCFLIMFCYDWWIK